MRAGKTIRRRQIRFAAAFGHRRHRYRACQQPAAVWDAPAPVGIEM